MPIIRTRTRALAAVTAVVAATAALASCSGSGDDAADGAATTAAESSSVRIYLTRHGETMLNALDLAQGWADSPLVESGVEDAENLGAGLREAGVEVDAAYSADMVRHYSTASLALEAMGADLDPARDERLREISFGRFEGAANEEMWTFAAEELAYADQGEMFGDFGGDVEFNDALDAIASGSEGTEFTAETSDEVADRAVDALTDIAEEAVSAGDESVLVVSSGITIMNALGALGADLSGVQGGIDNAAVSELVYQDGEWTVETVNDLSYVEAGAQE